MRTLSVKSAGVVVLLALAASLTACSFSTQVVIVNNSTQTLYVEYRVKDFTGKFAPPETPSTLPASELSSSKSDDWTQMRPWQYTVNSEQRTVSVPLMPRQALLVCRITNYGGHNEARADRFPISQIRLEGFSGTFLVSGEQAETRFTYQSMDLYVLEYK